MEQEITDTMEEVGMAKKNTRKKKNLLKFDKTIRSFNIGMNCREIDLQSVWHCHVHLIPRSRGDFVFHRGCVRHVIP